MIDKIINKIDDILKILRRNIIISTKTDHYEILDIGLEADKGMPWVAACLDLLVGPIIGYCIVIRRLALQAGILQEVGPNIGGTSDIGTVKIDDKMAPCAEEKRGQYF